MFKITVKWPSGDTRTVDGFEPDAVDNWVRFLWVAGADDVKVTCTCGECETCADRAVFEFGV